MLGFHREGWVTSVGPEGQSHPEIQYFIHPDVPIAYLRMSLCPTQGPDRGVADLAKLRIRPLQGHCYSDHSDLGLGLGFILPSGCSLHTSPFIGDFMHLAFIVCLQCLDCSCLQPPPFHLPFLNYSFPLNGQMPDILSGQRICFHWCVPVLREECLRTASLQHARGSHAPLHQRWDLIASLMEGDQSRCSK